MPNTRHVILVAITLYREKERHNKCIYIYIGYTRILACLVLREFGPLSTPKHVPRHLNAPPVFAELCCPDFWPFLRPLRRF